MIDKNLSHSKVNGKEDRVDACLRLSYFHLPSNLKQCFTICSVFPKGHRIDKEQLIDLWIAHDMITQKDGVDSLDLEYVGHKHFNSLLQVSFLQNVEEEHGRVTCGMHDLVHDLALSVLGDEISLDMPIEAISATKSYRYLSLIKRPEHVAPKNIFRMTRSVYMRLNGDYTCVMALKHAKHLRSVMVGYVDEEEANNISQVKYLKYLVMSLQNCEMLPEGISNVWSLQSLHVTRSYSLVEIPESICKLKMLRTLNLSGCIRLKSLPDSIGDCEMISSIDLCSCCELTVLSGSIGKLQKLRTLNLSQCTKLKCLPDSIGDCEMISSIDLCHCRELAVLPGSIGKMQKLRTMKLSWCEGLKCLPDSIGDCQMISSIDLWRCSKLTVLPDSIVRNEKLRVLRLSYTKLKSLPSSITKLRNLESLYIQGCCELVELPEGIGKLEKLQVLNLTHCDKLGGMPIGIGQLGRLQKLGLFVVGMGEKFARISELAKLSRIGDELTIRGISHVMDPNDAHMAGLKEKTNLQRLDLDWMSENMEEVNTELQQDVLDGLEPPPGIKELEIREYSGRRYARWMQSQVGGGVQGPAPFPFLRVMRLRGFPNLKHLHGLVELPCLEELELRRMYSLESISGGPFPSLVKLDMSFLPCLGEVWMVPERTMTDVEDGGGCYNYNLASHLGQVRVGSCLAELNIQRCHKLEVMPQLPLSLQHLFLVRSEKVLQSPGQCQGSFSSPSFNKLKKLQLWSVTGLGSGHGWELLQHMAALESLEIIGFYGGQTVVPESLGSLTSLRSLKVYDWSHIRVLPESLGELRCLQELTIEDCDSLTSLPESMGQLTSLQELIIKSCKALEQLPDSLGELCSLQVLEIYYCPGIKSLPEGIKDLTALKRLHIWCCPNLERRCERETGEDWHLISHIPDVSVDDWCATPLVLSSS